MTLPTDKILILVADSGRDHDAAAGDVKPARPERDPAIPGRRHSTLMACAMFLAVLLLTAASAHAGPLTGIVTYIQGNLIGDIEVLAIIGLGIILFAHHVNWFLIIGICAGIYVISNAPTIAAAITGGG